MPGCVRCSAVREEFIDVARRKPQDAGRRDAPCGHTGSRGLFALEHNVTRLADDHANARLLVDGLRELGVFRPTFPRRTSSSRMSFAATSTSGCGHFRRRACWRWFRPTAHAALTHITFRARRRGGTSSSHPGRGWGSSSLIRTYRWIAPALLLAGLAATVAATKRSPSRSLRHPPGTADESYEYVLSRAEDGDEYGNCTLETKLNDEDGLTRLSRICGTVKTRRREQYWSMPRRFCPARPTARSPSQRRTAGSPSRRLMSHRS